MSLVTSSATSKDNFARLLQGGSQRKPERCFGYFDFRRFAQRDTRMFGKVRKDLCEIPNLNLHHARRVPRKRLDLLKQRVVLRRELERLLHRQRIQWRAAAPPFAFQTEHDFSPRECLGKIRREN